METIKFVKIVPNAIMPIRTSAGAVGYDVCAARVLDKKSKEVISQLPAVIPPGESLLIGIGIIFALPLGYQCEIRPRSGLASQHDIELSNSPGTVDPDFRGEIGCLLRNRNTEISFKVLNGMRIAQLIFTEVEIPTFQRVATLSDLPLTRRGAGGFGSTGLFGPGLGTQEYEQHIQETDHYYMKVVLAAAERSRCVRGVKRIEGKLERDSQGHLIGQTRRFGCLIVKDDNIIAQGFNDQYLGSLKCEQAGCLREEQSIPSGIRIETCRAMHAEWWDLTNLARSGSGASTKGATMYLNNEPCEICAKIITGLGLEAVVMLEGVYPTNGTAILKEAGINIRYVKLKEE